MTTRVMNLKTGKSTFYTLDPESAVIAAHAQSNHDNNTWDYQEGYVLDVIHGSRTVSCGDFTAILED
ncbi:MAG: hypothetical protein KAI64_01480 [Thermoplasmata archaeon]|nr:hypothetical protein [Thermoplasmata archaeon]